MIFLSTKTKILTKNSLPKVDLQFSTSASQIMSSIPFAVIICKKCSAKVVNGWKCISCDSLYHPSCANKRNIKTVNESSILCCEKSVENNGLESDLAFFDAIEETCDKNRKVDFSIFTYVIRQKDIIIN